mgnify:CR=1 FL=1
MAEQTLVEQKEAAVGDLEVLRVDLDFFALGHGLVGNPDLVPETAESWDVGVRFSSADKFDFSITAISEPTSGISKK